MGLDTDDIVALSIDIPLICIAIILVVAMFFMKSPKVMKELRRELIKAQTNTEDRHKSLLEIVLGRNAYIEYLNKIKADAVKAFDESATYNPQTGETMTYQEQYLLDEKLFNSSSKPINPNTLKEYTWEEWEPLAEERFVYDHLKLFIRPSSLWHAINTRIESKQM